MKKLLNYFSKFEIALWSFSVLTIILSFALLENEGYSTLVASLVGVTSLIFIAKGNPVGQLLMIVFSIIYGAISYTFAYYGEMMTYLGMTLPMAVFSLVSWLKNPYNGNRAEVKVNKIGKNERIFMWLATVAVTAIFYFILEYFETNNLIPSTVSVATSFLGAYLTFRRSPFLSLAYAANDVVLVVLWSLASAQDLKYVSVTVCFVVFLFNDLYCFLNWQKMQKRQNLNDVKKENLT